MPRKETHFGNSQANHQRSYNAANRAEAQRQELNKKHEAENSHQWLDFRDPGENGEPDTHGRQCVTCRALRFKHPKTGEWV
jgi:hypothetical protein